MVNNNMLYTKKEWEEIRLMNTWYSYGVNDEKANSREVSWASLKETFTKPFSRPFNFSIGEWLELWRNRYGGWRFAIKIYWKERFVRLELSHIGLWFHVYPSHVKQFGKWIILWRY